MSNVYPVIPAGGSGKRLWPLSRAGYPKFLQPLGGTDHSLLADTVQRLTTVADVDNVYVVTGSAHAPFIARDVPQVAAHNILVEPSPRDSAPAIALAAAVIHQRDPQAIMASFAADHVIRDVASFSWAVRQAIKGAEAGYLMTIGITPSRPETGFGYIHSGQAIDGGPLREVRQFREKPPLEVARQYVAAGTYLWNASMFVWQTKVFLDELARRDAAMHQAVTDIAAAWDTPHRDEVMARLWPTLTKIAIDYLIMEPAAGEGKVATVPGTFDWSDVGDFDAVGDAALAAHGDDNGNVVLHCSPATQIADEPAAAAHSQPPEVSAVPQPPRLLTHDARNAVVVSAGSRPVAIVGVDNLAVVDMDDVLLVCSRNRVQDVKHVVETLDQQGLTELA